MVLLVSGRVAFVGVRLATVGLLLRVSLRGVPGLLVLVARPVAATVRVPFGVKVGVKVGPEAGAAEPLPG